MLILLAFSSGLTECTTGSEQQSKQRPNIVFIMSDDHAYQAISSYGGPSRATILTGKYSHKNGFVDNTNGTKFDFSQLTFTKVLQAGYKTAMIWRGIGGWSTLYGHDATQGTSPLMGPGTK
jgi:hypothetical protein